MISYISGTIKYKTENSLIILVQGLGYEVFINSKVLGIYQLDENVEFFIYQNVKEDALTLFGFVRYEELSLFKKLISVSGVGPKSGLGILEIASVEDIVTSIYNNDPNLLIRVSGIGKKTAERLVLELKNKIGLLDIKNKDKQSLISNDEIDTLIALGYSASQAREALNMVPKDIVDINSRIKNALKYLGR